MTLLASSQRMVGAIHKRNPYSITGEAIYIGGDLALMFTDSHTYGGNEMNIQKLSTNIASHVNGLPLILGPSAQEKFVKNTVKFLLDKSMAEINANPSEKNPKWETLKSRADALTQVLDRQIHHQQGEHYDHVSDLIADMVVKFPKAQRPEAKKRLAAALEQMPWLHATPTEINEVLNKSLAKLPVHTPSKAPELTDFKKDIVELVSVIPGTDIGAAAAALHDALDAAIKAPAHEATQHAENPVHHDAKTMHQHETALAHPPEVPHPVIPAHAPRDAHPMMAAAHQAIS